MTASLQYFTSSFGTPETAEDSGPIVDRIIFHPRNDCDVEFPGGILVSYWNGGLTIDLLEKDADSLEETRRPIGWLEPHPTDSGLPVDAWGTLQASGLPRLYLYNGQDEVALVTFGADVRIALDGLDAPRNAIVVR